MATLTQLQKLNFTPVGFRLGAPATVDFWELASEAKDKPGKVDICSEQYIVGTEQSNINCKEFELYGTQCYRIGAHEYKVANLLGVKNFYDASRGGMLEDVEGVGGLGTQHLFPYSPPKCPTIAQVYYSGWKGQEFPDDPRIALSHSYAADPENQEQDGAFEQIAVGYANFPSNHPYGHKDEMTAVSSPYSTKQYGDYSRSVVHDNYAGFTSPFMHRIFLKKISTKPIDHKPGIVFDKLEYSFFSTANIHFTLPDTIIEVSADSITIDVSKKPDVDKHYLKFNTCKPCVKDQAVGAFNVTSTGENPLVNHFRESGTLDEIQFETHPAAFDGFDGEVYSARGGIYAGRTTQVWRSPYWGNRGTEEGGCQHCHDELLASYQRRNSSSSVYGSNLISKM